MGNSESQSVQEVWRNQFSAEERTYLGDIFDIMSGSNTTEETKGGKAPKQQLTLSMLEAYIKGAVTGRMIIRMYNGMRNIHPMKKLNVADSVSKKQFLSFLYYTMRGSVEERSFVIQHMISSQPDGPVTGRQVKEFTEDVIVSVIHLLNKEKMLMGWKMEKTGDCILGTSRLTAYLMTELKAKGEDLSLEHLQTVKLGQDALKDWMCRASVIITFLHALVALALHLTKSEYQGELFSPNQVLPLCLGIEYSGIVTVLDIPSVIYLKPNLPSRNQRQWKLLFSSQAHGESFSRLSTQILHKGPTLLVVKDSLGYVFGGFASCSWELKPQFQGDSRCFLFTLNPKLGIYSCTGYNEHYMYLNVGQQTMPNGLGMGGQHNYFGLWIDSNYGKGHSKAKPRCTTYNSPQLSAEEHFTIDTLEVWMVGNLPASELSKTKSILDTDPEAQALLEMVGKTRVSDGLRDPGGDEEKE
ncbi:MTOR-associated protein MEAK7 isoform X2 [Hypanus sabinus]|uniref:MTOR-associated protein MEAK7 isoform X2 n=1 Tax=Hypanus sabinus TaxID=79690 RepID=UPI0028C3F35C|nr:MTOR-associated protein MEAK7 isoform X2 [Hypanus sabinus]